MPKISVSMRSIRWWRFSSAIGDFAALPRERNVAVAPRADQRVALQALDGHGDRGRRNLQPARQRGCDYRLAFALGLRDGLEVILLGYGNFHAKSNCIVFVRAGECGAPPLLNRATEETVRRGAHDLKRNPARTLLTPQKTSKQINVEHADR